MREVVATALVPVPRFVERGDIGDCEGFNVIFGYLMAYPLFPNFLGASKVGSATGSLG